MWRHVDTMGLLIYAFADSGKERAVGAFETYEAEILDYARSNAPWQDRTGWARQGLDTEVIVDGDSVELELFHTAPHGQWLETIQGGQFATIMPTLETYAQRVFNEAGARFMGKGL